MTEDPTALIAYQYTFFCMRKVVNVHQLHHFNPKQTIKQTNTPINYHNRLTFSQSGSINVNKSLLFALLLSTSAPPAFPRMISPAF